MEHRHHHHHPTSSVVGSPDRVRWGTHSTTRLAPQRHSTGAGSKLAGLMTAPALRAYSRPGPAYSRLAGPAPFGTAAAADQGFASKSAIFKSIIQQPSRARAPRPCNPTQRQPTAKDSPPSHLPRRLAAHALQGSCLGPKGSPSRGANRHRSVPRFQVDVLRGSACASMDAWRHGQMCKARALSFRARASEHGEGVRGKIQNRIVLEATGHMHRRPAGAEKEKKKAISIAWVNGSRAWPSLTYMRTAAETEESLAERCNTCVRASVHGACMCLLERQRPSAASDLRMEWIENLGWRC